MGVVSVRRDHGGARKVLRRETPGKFGAGYAIEGTEAGKDQWKREGWPLVEGKRPN